METHRAEMRATIIAAADALIRANGLLSLNMSDLAEEAAIARATLYKYFPDLEAVLLAWHEGQVATHLHALRDAAGRETAPAARLAATLEAYARVLYERPRVHDPQLTAMLHRSPGTHLAEHTLHELVRGLIAEGAAAGDLRADISATELAAYAIHALDAATQVASAAAVRRLVQVTLAGTKRTPSVSK